MEQRTCKFRTFGQLALLMMLGAVAGSASAFDFKGLVLGEATTPAQVEAVFATCVPFRGNRCSEIEQALHDQSRIVCGEGVPGIMVCNGITTIAGHTAKANIVIGLSRELQRISLTQIDSDYFDDIQEALVAKFGRPKVIGRSRMQNSFGAQYQQVEYGWSDQRGRRVVVQKYAGRVNESSVTYDTPEDRAMLTERPAKKHDL